jgi:hypothetical protein
MPQPIMKICAVLLALSFAAAAAPLSRAQSLEAGFVNPPDDTKPWCYWYWISDHISKEGITRDLEAMARVGIGEAFIGNIFLEDVPAGKVKVLSPEWWSLVEHAIREGGRTGVGIGLFNCPGWSQSGGPWIQPTETMRYLVASETRIRGPQRFTGKLPVPKEPFQDVAVLAFRAPRLDADWLGARAPRVTCVPADDGVGRLVDGDFATVLPFPDGAGLGAHPFTVEFELAAPITVRSLQIVPAEAPFRAQCELQAVTTDGVYQTVRRFRCDRSNLSVNVGFMPRGPVTVSFPAATAKAFRLVFTDVSGGRRPALAEVNLSGAARLEAFVEKQLGKMHPTPLPRWDTYLWPTQAEPDDPALVVPPAEVRDLSRQLAPDGTLAWDVPAGDWIIQRLGMTPTGVKNSPASPEGQGLEVDKMNRALAQRHFDAFIGQVLMRVPAPDRQAFKRVVADSYEMGSQNWTDGFETQFRQHYGYDPKPWLPVLSGRLIGSADQSERFLWDLRRLIADRIATEYVGGLREACRAHGLGLWLENYGHWGFPSEFLKYGAESDRIGGEYWVTGELGSIELRAASSCANTYGRKFVSAESFTGGPAYQNAPAALKARGDWAFCEGVNHYVLHVNIHQPWEDRRPGVNAWFGTEFNRHNTWFERSLAWVNYVRRCCWLLQQGNRVADVAYFIGEDAPKMTGVRQPELPPGRDFDYINAEVIETTLQVSHGRLALPQGPTYQVLVLPKWDTMRPEVLRKIRDLVAAGATVLGPPPARSPSLQGYPRCDDEVRKLAAELWGSATPGPAGERPFGQGRIVWGKSLSEVFASLNSRPDFESSTLLRFTHRRSGQTDIYFVANPKGEPLTTTAAFRVGEKAPEFWWPDSGRVEHPAVYDCADSVVRLPISFGPHGSVFVLFREKAAAPSERLVSVQHNGREILGTAVRPAAHAETGDSPNNFAFAVWCKPADATTLVAETNRGVIGLNEKRNDALSAPHGDGFGGNGHAGCGLAVGTNGVCVFEHGANYFAPTLVYTGRLNGWTHLAVVYRDGQPSLYLNGALVRTGLKSERVVHSGAGTGGQAQFRSKLGSFAQFRRALSDREVADLTRTMPRPDQGLAGPPIQLAKAGGELTALAEQPGEYELVYANGQRRKLAVTGLPPAQLLDGPWEVEFDPAWGAPARVTFDALDDWTQRDEDGIRHYSGKAIYRKTIELSSAQASKTGSRLLLDLGEVRDLATVRLNGKELGTLWIAPWRLDITTAIQPGSNILDLEIINVWNNRLAGDAALPPAQRRTFLLAPTVKANAPLLPAGLLGPVRLVQLKAAIQN